MRAALETIRHAQAQNRPIKKVGPLNPKAALVTDGVIYRQAAVDIGRLPEILIQRVIMFYSAAQEISRIAEIGGEFETTLSNISAQGPGFRMYGELALDAIRKLREADYEPLARIEPTLDEIKKMAERAGYPMEQALKEYGLCTVANHED